MATRWRRRLVWGDRPLDHERIRPARPSWTATVRRRLTKGEPFPNRRSINEVASEGLVLDTPPNGQSQHRLEGIQVGSSSGMVFQIHAHAVGGLRPVFPDSTT